MIKIAIRSAKYALFFCLMKIKNGRSIHIGKTLSINKLPSVSIKGESSISIGEHCSFDGGSISSVEKGKIQIGSYSCFGENLIIVAREKIIIGEKCIIAPNVCFFDHDHIFDSNGYSTGYKYGEIVVGNHVWIGANVVILRGSKIGNNCIIGAGCVIKGSMPDNTIIYSKQNYVIREL